METIILGRDVERRRNVSAVVLEQGSSHGSRKLGADAGRAGRGRGQRSFSQFRGVRLKQGAVAAQGPPQLSDAGDLRRNGRVGGRCFSRRTPTPTGRSLTAVINAFEINEMLKRSTRVLRACACSVMNKSVTINRVSRVTYL